MRTGSRIALVAAALAVAAIGAVAQTPAPQPAQRGPASSALNYVPGVGDMMNSLVQPRHVKLWLAGHEKNWELAAYAYKEMQQALNTVGTVQPKFRNLTVPEMIESMTGEAMRDLQSAIDARDAKKFADAFDSLTDGCNSCHTALNHGFIVIKVPEASAFPNQEFKGP
jgi:cytochrome c556